MKKLNSILVICVVLTSCSNRPDFNPFNSEFDFEISEILKVSSDTIGGSGNYYNIGKSTPHFTAYYMIDSSSVVAKGCFINLDVLMFDADTARAYEDSIESIILTYPINTSKVNRILNNLGLKPNPVSDDGLSFIDSENNEINFTRSYDFEWTEDSIKFMRILTFMKFKNENHVSQQRL